MVTPETMKESGRKQAILAYLWKEFTKRGYSAEEFDKIFKEYIKFLTTPEGESDLDEFVEMMLEQFGRDKNIFPISIATTTSFALIAKELIKSGRLSGGEKIIRDCEFIDHVPDNQEGTIKIELIQVVPEGATFSHQEVLNEIARRKEYVGLATPTQGLSIVSQRFDVLEDLRRQDEYDTLNIMLLGDTFRSGGLTYVVNIVSSDDGGYVLGSYQVDRGERYHSYHLFTVVLKEE